MRKIINGKVYDTETANFIGSDSYGNIGDFRYWYEELYLTKKGAFFLYGEGGPLSRYRKEVGMKEWVGDSQIKLMTEEEAREWAEKHLSVKRYEKTFGKIEEG